MNHKPHQVPNSKPSSKQNGKDGQFHGAKPGINNQVEGSSPSLIKNPKAYYAVVKDTIPMIVTDENLVTNKKVTLHATFHSKPPAMKWLADYSKEGIDDGKDDNMRNHSMNMVNSVSTIPSQPNPSNWATPRSTKSTGQKVVDIKPKSCKS